MAEEKIAFLRRFISERPGFKDVVFIVVKGKPMSPVDALDSLERGVDVDAIISAMTTAGYDPKQALEEMALEYYQRLAKIRPRFKFVVIAPGVREEITMERAVNEIRSRTALGDKILDSYASLLQLMSEKMRS